MRVADDTLEFKPGVAPNSFAELRLDAPRQACHIGGTIHWVAPAERNIEVVVSQYLHYFVVAHLSAAVHVPRLRVVATFASVMATGKID